MLILETIFIFILLGCSSALFSFFIDFCFNEGNIFDFYYYWLLEKVEPKYPKLFKMLGGCNICFNFWFSLFVYIIYCFFVFKTISLFYFLPFISFSCFVSYLINKLFS